MRDVSTAAEALTVGVRYVKLSVFDTKRFAYAVCGRTDVSMSPSSALALYMETGELLDGCEVEEVKE